ELTTELERRSARRPVEDHSGRELLRLAADRAVTGCGGAERCGIPSRGDDALGSRARSRQPLARAPAPAAGARRVDHAQRLVGLRRTSRRRAGAGDTRGVRRVARGALLTGDGTVALGPRGPGAAARRGAA